MINLLRKFPIIQKNSSSTPKSKCNEYTAPLECNKSFTNVSNNSKNSSSTPKSKPNERTASLECDKSSKKVPIIQKTLFLL